jgi:hypothetical protein
MAATQPAAQGAVWDAKAGRAADAAAETKLCSTSLKGLGVMYEN